MHALEVVRAVRARVARSATRSPSWRPTSTPAFVHDAVARVERDERIVHLQSGDELPYDVLVLAVGAFPYPAYEHGVCFQRAHDAEASTTRRRRPARRPGRAVAIVVPPGCTWTLPAYELALMAAALVKPAPADARHARARAAERSSAPPAGAAGARSLLEAAGVDLLAGVDATVPHTRRSSSSRRAPA